MLVNLLNTDATLSVHSASRPLLDLKKTISRKFAEFIKTEKFHYVIICAAITDVEKCYQEQAMSNLVNVVGMRALLDLVKENGAIPIFFSSDYVFSGKTYPYRESDSCNPQTIFGHENGSEEMIENINIQ